MQYIKHNSYQEYKDVQTKTNKAKLANIWARPGTMKDIKDYCDKLNLPVHNIICHGTRNGAELQYFQQAFPGTNVIGTEISDTATQFPNTVQWDFHDENKEWIGKFDIVYSNSWDHAYDFHKAIDTWMRSLTPTGRLFLEWTRGHIQATDKSDCFGLPLQELIDILSENYECEDQFDIPVLNGCIVVVKHKPKIYDKENNENN